MPSKLHVGVNDLQISTNYIYNCIATVENIANKSVLIHFISKFTKSLLSFDSLNLYHGNIKPSNVFIQFFSYPQFKLYLSDQLQYYMYNSKIIPINLSTLQFSSPEMILSKQTSISTDIWSFGNILYYFMTGKELFTSMKIKSLYLSMKKDINGNIDKLKLSFYNIPTFIIDIVRNCIKFKSEERITLNEISEKVNNFKLEDKAKKSFNKIDNILIYNSIHTKCILHSDNCNNKSNNTQNENKGCLYASGIPQYSFLLHSFHNLTELNINGITLSTLDTKYISNSFQYIDKLILLVLTSIFYYFFIYYRM